MGDKPTLKLIRASSRPRSANNFWQCCLLAKEYLPETACTKGQPDSTPGKIPDESECPWWLNSAQHHYCFWRYIRDKSDVDGVMKELVQSELAALFGWSNTKTHFMLKQAMTELTEALKLYGAKELLQDLNSDDLENAFTLEDLVDLEHEESSE